MSKSAYTSFIHAVTLICFSLACGEASQPYKNYNDMTAQDSGSGGPGDTDFEKVTGSGGTYGYGGSAGVQDIPVVDAALTDDTRKDIVADASTQVDFSQPIADGAVQVTDTGSLVDPSQPIADSAAQDDADDQKSTEPEVEDAGQDATDTEIKNPVPDYTEVGPFQTTREPASVGDDCSVYRPSELGQTGAKHPVVIWGNANDDRSSEYGSLLDHFASYGLIVVAAATYEVGDGTVMIDCLDWIIDQNDRSGSEYENQIDTDAIASAGFSEGGCGCLMAGKDSRVKATLPVSPYFRRGGDCTLPEAVEDQIHPMFLISGGRDTTADPEDHQQPIFEDAKAPIVWGTASSANHSEVADDGGVYRGPMTAWLLYQLMDDAVAGDIFKTTPCLLCEETDWNVQRNSLWTD